MKQSSVDEKIMADLKVVTDKMDQCDRLMREGASLGVVGQDETLLSVIGFLEACVPRMVELVEAAAQGGLSELVLMQCLEVNDRLTKQLSDIDNSTTGTTGATGVAAAAQEDAFFEEIVFDEVPSKPAFRTERKSTGEDDPFGNTVAKSVPVGGSTQPDVASAGRTKSEEEFDDFFSKRQGGS